MKKLTLFDYEDFKTCIDKYDAEDVIAVCIEEKKVGEYLIRGYVKATTVSNDVLIELIYYSKTEPYAFLNREELHKKAKELMKKLTEDGFYAVDGYWGEE